MNAGLVAAVAAAGGVGAALRHLVDTLVARRLRHAGATYPAGVLLINLSGSLVLGVVVGLAAGSVGSSPPHSAAVAVLGTGLLGGYTTFSTAVLDVVVLLEAGRCRAALLHGPGMVLLGVGLAALGWWAGAALSPR